MWIGPCQYHALHHLPGFGAGFLGVFCHDSGGLLGSGGRRASVSLRWHGPFVGCGALGLLKTMTSTCVSGFRGFRGLVASGRFVLLQWCVCCFSRFWGIFSVV